MQKFALSILGQDRPGIVAGVAEILADSGCNIEDLSQTILQGEFAAIYIFSKPDQVLPEDLIHSLKQALNPWGLKNLFAWVDLFLRQYRVWLIKKKMGSELPIFLTSFLKNY